MIPNGHQLISPSGQPLYQFGVPIVNQCQQHTYYALPSSPHSPDPNMFFPPWVIQQVLVPAQNGANNGYHVTTASNNNNNIIPANPNYTQVAFIGQYPIMVDSNPSPVGPPSSTTPTYATSPGPSPVLTNGTQVFQYQQREIAQ